MVEKMGSYYFKMFTNCLIVRGNQRALIFDAQRKQYHLVPLSFADLIEALDGKKIEAVLAKFEVNKPEILEEYFQFIFEKELAFLCNNKQEIDRFPVMSMEWDYAAVLTNAVVLLPNQTALDEFILFQAQHFIGFIQYQIIDEIPDVETLRRYVRQMCRGNVKGIQVIFDNGNNIPMNEILELCNTSQIETIVAFNSPYDEVVKSVVCNVWFVTQPKVDYLHCGRISSSYFNVQIEHFTESQHHNTCLNRKISIDVDGNIKNCPSMSKSYGNIRDTKLIDVVNNPEFQKVWHIKKDEITKCKDCEFRHVCTDCRAYLENPDDQYSAPLKCGYNPYTCEWEEWSTNPLKQKAIEFYGMQDLVKKS